MAVVARKAIAAIVAKDDIANAITFIIADILNNNASFCSAQSPLQTKGILSSNIGEGLDNESFSPSHANSAGIINGESPSLAKDLR